MAWAPDYITAAELKAFLRIDDTADDVQLGVAITAASRAVDSHCNRQFGVVAAAAEFKYTAWANTERGVWVIDVDDLMTTTNLAIEVDGTALAVDEYTLEPVNAAAKGRPWTCLTVADDSATQPTGVAHEVAVTALWGWTTVPTAVKQATYLQASRFFARRQSPYGIAGSPDQGSELRLLSRVDPDVAVSLTDYRRPRAVG
jgi:uncharacterized phiE125 gp8 family phage protein